MCGRFSLFKISEFLKKYNFDEKMSPRYNIAPTQKTPIIRNEKLDLMKWGLQFKTNVINTRVETWESKPFFKHMERILVPADGYYEWNNKQPFRIEAKEVFTFAGLIHKDGFSIVTLPATANLKKVHERMPAVLDDEKAWLKNGELNLQKKFDIFKISKLVNVPRNDIPDVIKREE